MPVVAFRKKVTKRRKRRLVPHKRIFKVKSLIPKRTIYIHKGRFRLFKHRTQRARMFRRFNLWIVPTAPTKSYSQKYTRPKKPSQKSFSKVKTKQDWGAEKKTWAKTWQTSAYKKLYKPADTGGFPKHLSEWAKEPYIREMLKTRPKPKPKKIVKKKENWGGKREYKWKGKYYGVKKALGPKLIFEVFPTHKYYMYIRARKSYGDHMAVIKAIRKALQKVIDGLIKRVEINVDKYVPKDTGDLREAMIDSIKNSKVRGMTLKVELDTGKIEYANWVNRMPEHKIRHDAANKQISRKTGRFLHDPKAVEGWFKYIQMQLNEEAGKLLTVFIEDVVQAFSFIYFRKKATLKQKIYETRKPYSVVQHGRPIEKSGRVIVPKPEKTEKVYKFYGDIGTVSEQDRSEMSRHKRMNRWRLDIKKEESELVEYPRDLIMKMFKIRGLYKGNRVY